MPFLLILSPILQVDLFVKQPYFSLIFFRGLYFWSSNSSFYFYFGRVRARRFRRTFRVFFLLLVVILSFDLLDHIFDFLKLSLPFCFLLRSGENRPFLEWHPVPFFFIFILAFIGGSNPAVFRMTSRVFFRRFFLSLEVVLFVILFLQDISCLLFALSTNIIFWFFGSYFWSLFGRVRARIWDLNNLCFSSF